MKNTVRKSDLIIIVCLVLVFGAIIFMNTRLINSMMLSQKEESNQNRLEIIRSEYENISMEVEKVLIQIVNQADRINYMGASRESMEAYIKMVSDYFKEDSGGVVLRIYAVGPDWVILPDESVPDGYNLTQQNWYTGAVEKKGELYFADPYYDRLTGIRCFTLAIVLSDGETVIGMDMKMDGVEDYIKQMAGEERSPALIVTDTGLIVGYTDMSLAGKMVEDALPEYSNVLDRIIRSENKKGSFEVRVDGVDRTIFHSAMRNGWYMALVMSDEALYGEAIKQRAVNIIVNVLLLLLILVTFIASSRNRIRAQEALSSREAFVSRILDNLREPLGKILRLSDIERFNNSNDIKTDLADIKASGIEMREMMDNLRSYSTIVTGVRRGNSGKKKRRELARSIKIFRNVIIVILLAVSGISMFFYIRNRSSVVRETIMSDVESFEAELTQWEVEQSTVLHMFTEIICSQPQMLKNYYSTVDWLNRMSKNFSSFSVCYVANPNAEHPVIMNSGWSGDPDWDFTERQWYREALDNYPNQCISAPYYEHTNGAYCITISEAMYDEEGNFLGVFGIDIYLDKLIDIFENEVYEDKYAFLVDGNGSIINHPNSAYQMTADHEVKVTDTPYAGSYLSAVDGMSNIRNIRDYDDKYAICVCTQDSLTGFSIIMVGNWWMNYREILVYCMIYILFVIIAIITVIVLLNRVIRSQADMNRELAVTADRAMAAGQAKSDFLAQMSHEIRTPINAVIGMDEMILRENHDPEIQEYAENIKSASQTLLTLINGILDFSKIESGKMEILRVRYETLDMIDHLVNMISDRTEKKGLNLILDIDPTLPKSLFGDDVRVRQVITNLLTNAVKYTREGDVTLSIRGEKGEDQDSYFLKVAVKDTGIGIKAEDLDKLFLSFQRLDEEKNRNIEGTGLGMSIVQGLLAMMDSKLDVQSEYGAGSTFSFRLEQKIIDGTEIGEYHYNQAREDETTVARKTPIFTGASILVVDDNEMNLKVARGLLKRYGVIPDLCASGRKSLDMIRDKRYDIILMDHMMPGMDGVEVLREVRAQNLTPEDVPIIALTANAIMGAREEYLAHGFKDYLSKPIDVIQLEDMLIHYLPEDKVRFKEDEEEAEAASGKTESDADGGTGKSESEADGGTEKPEGKTEGKAGGGAGKSEGEAGGGTEKPEADTSGDTAIEAAADQGADGGDSAGGSFTDRLAQAGFNIEEAHSYTMDDDEFYLELLETYVSGAGDKEESIRKFFAEKDWKNYQITVHGLKSSSRTIGADHLADLALAQEMAAKEGNVTAIEEGVDELLEVFKKAVEDISGALS